PWPDSALFPNRKSGQHWATYQRAKASARLEGYWAAEKATGCTKPDLEQRTPIRIIFHAPDRRRRDIDGMHGAIKNALDGIAKGLGVDDSIFCPVTIDATLDPKKQGFVIVEIGT